jgi:hypothetical protein
MTRGILITGNETALFSAITSEALKRVESFASVLISNRFPIPAGGNVKPVFEVSGGAIPLSWNPASSISARTVVLAAENRLGQINDAILVCSPPAVFKSAEALMPEEIEIFVNDQIKGWFFLIRELVLYFRRFGSGSLSLVVPETGSWGKNAPVDLLGVSAEASFRAFAQGILALSTNMPFGVNGFTGCEAGAEEEFAAWLFKTIDGGTGKNSGRWNKYSKLKFFR